MPTIHLPAIPAPGMQAAGFHQQFRVGTCEEAECEWFLYGHDGVDHLPPCKSHSSRETCPECDHEAPFNHPQGVQCGDFQRCTDPNCPCPDRVKAVSRTTGRRGHLVVDIQVMPVLSVSELADQRYPQSVRTRPVVTDEWLTRLHEGTDTIQRLRTRGL